MGNFLPQEISRVQRVNKNRDFSDLNIFAVISVWLSLTFHQLATSSAPLSFTLLIRQVSFPSFNSQLLFKLLKKLGSSHMKNDAVKLLKDVLKKKWQKEYYNRHFLSVNVISCLF